MLLAPNGKPTNLTPEQYRLVRSKNFIDWFGDWENDSEKASKVVDENGEPLVVNHTYDTENAPNVFKKSKEVYIDGKYKRIFENDDIYKKLEGIYGTTVIDGVEYNVESDYWEFWFTNKIFGGGSNLKYISCFLNIRNLYVNENGYGGQGSFGNMKTDYDGISGVKITNADGQEGVDYYIVLFSNQIKLADGTNTTFDGSNPDIRFKMGGLFHGSTHDFNKFESNKNIGKGEGEQMYGYGLYFTNRKDKAISYASKYLRDNYNNWLNDYNLNIYQKMIIVFALKDGNFDIEKAKKLIPKIDVAKVTQQERKKFIPILEDFDKKSKNKRILYSVTINKDKENDIFLDWDKKIPQPYAYKIYESIENPLFKRKVTKSKKEVYQDLLKRFNSLDFNIIYNMLSYIIGSEKNASLFLLKLGIDGVIKKFKKEDIGNEGVIYYIVFDENAVSIESSKKFELGGSISDLLSSQEVEDKLDRELDLWNDDIVYLSGIKYKKVYLRPEYKRVIE